MSRQREFDWKKSLLCFLTAFLLASGMSLCILSALLPSPGTLPVLAVCFGCCLALEGLTALRMRGKAFIVLGLLAALAVWGVMGGGPVHALIQLGKAVALTAKSVPGALLPYADAARTALCVSVSLMAVFMAHDQALPLACFCVVAAGLLCFLFSGDRLPLILPALAGLLMMLASTGSLRAAAIPVAAVLTALAFLLTPAEPPVQPELAQAAADIREMLEDYLFFHEYRAAFTLTSEGYKPEKERLGGPAEPRDHMVMEVETDETLWLRGCAYDAYTGLDWYDSLSERRYLFASSRLDDLREATFDLTLPMTGQEALPEKQLRVEMLGDAATTLFVPQRIRDIRTDGGRMVLYFNTASELFITRNLAAGDAYSLSFLSLSPLSARTKALVSACAGIQDARYAQVAEDYLKLPGHIQKEIREIAENVTEGCATPLDKALALQNYLQRNYKYSLDVETPPDNVDFTAWFLLGEKKGYCTYFATAMTVLSRLCGLPARYVTGYLAIPDERGKATVTGRNAHAWTEIYFNGFGWLTFDATPRGDNDQPADDPSAEPEGAPTPTPQPPEPAATPEPSPEPTPAPTPAPEEEQTSPPPSDVPENTPEPEQPETEPETPRAFPWLLLLLFLLALGLTLRLLYTEPLRAAKRKPQQAAETLLRALLSLLALRHVKRAPQETWHAFGLRADEALQGQGLPPVTPLAEAYAAQLYGRHPADPEPFRQAYLAYRERLGLPGRLRLALKRMFTRQ